jgi:hypothetical protein
MNGFKITIGHLTTKSSRLRILNLLNMIYIISTIS